MLTESISRKIPNYAADTKVNLQNILSGELEGLTSGHLYGIAISVCYALKNEQLLNFIRNEAKLFIEDQHFEAAKTACALMALNNTYFNFIEIVDEPDIVFQASDLFMDALHQPKIDKIEFEMYMLAVSIVNSCKYCIRFHKDKLIKKGISKVAIKNIARIASVLKSVTQVLEMENLRVYDFVLRGENF